MGSTFSTTDNTITNINDKFYTPDINIDDCAEINSITNMCGIHSCVSNVRGLSSNSVSPSDTWILTFNSDTKYDNNEINNAFMKFWISEVPSVLKEKFEESSKSLEGLNYELRVYSEIVRQLIDYNICPNFIRYLGSGKSCSFADIISIINGKAIDYKGNNINTDQIERNLIRNIWYMLLEEDNRPSITTNTTALWYDTIYNNIETHSSEIKFNILINEKAQNSKNFYDFMNAEGYFYDISNEAWKVIFQIFAGIYALSLTKTVHNDLHIQNVMVEETDDPTQYVYNLNDDVYVFESKYKAMIFDYDRAYSEQFGENDLLNSILCGTIASQCNEFVENKDAIKFLLEVYMEVTEQDDKTIILDILTDNDSAKKDIETLAKGNRLGACLMFSENQELTDYDRFRPMYKMVEKVAHYAQLSKNGTPKYGMYTVESTCHPNMFDANGKIKQDGAPVEDSATTPLFTDLFDKSQLLSQMQSLTLSTPLSPIDEEPTQPRKLRSRVRRNRPDYKV